MDAPEGTSRRRLSAGQLPYPNHSLGDMAALNNVDFKDEDVKEDKSSLIKGHLSCARQVVLVTCLMLGFLFSIVDTCIVSIPLITISEELGNHTHAPWVILSYLLTYMAFATGISQLSDIYGRRNLLLFSWIIFIAFSMGCGAATSMTALIICRAFQGLGGSGLYSLAQVSIVEVGPGHRPSVVGAMMGGTLAFAFICGPLLGGLITERISWRWIFNINVPFGLAVLGALVICWPAEPQAAHIFSRAAFNSIDFVGGFSLLCGSGFLVYGIQQGGSEAAAWSDPEIIAALSIASLSWIIFFGWEYLLARQRFPHIAPIFPVRLATNRVYMAGLAVTLLTGFPFVPLTVIIPERFQIVYRNQPLTAGVHLLPMLGACAFGSFLSGAICNKRNYTSYILMTAASFQIIGLGLMSTLQGTEADIRASYGYQTIFGLGSGLVFSSATILAAVNSAAENDLAVANGAMAQVRVFGGCIGIATCTVIFNSHFNSLLHNDLTPEQFDQLHRSPSSALNWSTSDYEMVRDVYAMAYPEQLKVMVYVAAFSLLASFLTFEKNPTPVQAAVAVAKERLMKHHDSDIELNDRRSLQAR
ncbi:drug resistance transporter [Plectosphaerella plurivora]|uniref:Drug resistance transporter n=1 Tax=Plectosphaerella plurivora TaxID=936078 RepID=A0A9P9AH78_9PEZI|nr:drug resistance transporter [Plectosphaerella plurivora]